MKFRAKGRVSFYLYKTSSTRSPWAGVPYRGSSSFVAKIEKVSLKKEILLVVMVVVSAWVGAWLAISLWEENKGEPGPASWKENKAEPGPASTRSSYKSLRERRVSKASGLTPLGLGLWALQATLNLCNPEARLETEKATQPGTVTRAIRTLNLLVGGRYRRFSWLLGLF